ncbi:hypothetical protein BGZ75_007097 [Mortierella antarctica]|nr:hypothetical protein BGZ67_006237 [Mortierella alpina]KAF9981551.1 hypothetical protein BGZ75_007097 [Mortierella antarctica]
MPRVHFDELCADFEDISPSDLGEKVSSVLHAPYLQEASVVGSRKLVQGAVWGANLRPIISLDVQITESITTLSGTRKPVHVHFLYLQASPQTYLSDEAMRAIGIEDMVVAGESLASSDSAMQIPLYINGYRSQVIRSPNDSHFAHLNILGEDFIEATGAKVFFGGNEPQFAIQFP